MAYSWLRLGMLPAVELDSQAMILHDVEPRLGRLRRGGVVDEPELEPDRAGAGRDRVLDDGREMLDAPERVDEVGWLGKVGQRRVHTTTERLADVGVDEHDGPVGSADQVCGHPSTGALRIARDADHRHRARAFQQFVDLVVGAQNAPTLPSHPVIMLARNEMAETRPRPGSARP